MKEKSLYQQVYLNNKGFFFDSYIKDKIYTVETLLYKKPLVKTNLEDELDENKFYYIQFPSKNNIIKQLNNLKKTSFILELLPNQNEEKLILSSYFRIEEIEINLTDLLRIFNLNSKLEHREVKKLAKNNLKYKIAYCLLFVADELNINPSHYVHPAYNLFTFKDFKNIGIIKAVETKKPLYPYTTKLLNHYSLLKQLPINLFYDLLFSEITNEDNDVIKLYKKIIDNNFNSCKELYTQKEYQKILEFNNIEIVQDKFFFNLMN